MPKKSITSLELAALVNELQFLVRGKITQIYHQEKKELLFQLHASGEGKKLLKIVPGKFISLTKNKDTPTRPSGFCMQLRKYVNNSFIKSIEQKGTERVIVIELEKQENYKLIIELFSKGNLILIDDKDMIISVLEWQRWKDRTIKPKEKYKFPAPGLNWKELNGKGFLEVFKKSEKKNLATSLATEIGLGGIYAEEICKVNNIDKKKLPSEIEDKEVKLIVKTIKEFLKKIEKPSGYIYEEQITPFELSEEKIVKKTATYIEAIDTLNPFEIVSPYQQRINALKRMISNQEEAIGKQEDNIELNTQKGELIYEKYTPLQKLLDIVKEMKKDKDWSDIGIALKKEKKIKGVDLKNKKVVIDL
jgi:predicted ribosome quality control (RQC) complex YloA/Tae2 family protein